MASGPAPGVGVCGGGAGVHAPVMPVTPAGVGVLPGSASRVGASESVMLVGLGVSTPVATDTPDANTLPHTWQRPACAGAVLPHWGQSMDYLTCNGVDYRPSALGRQSGKPEMSRFCYLCRGVNTPGVINAPHA